jgi:hypothetical protein
MHISRRGQSIGGITQDQDSERRERRTSQAWSRKHDNGQNSAAPGRANHALASERASGPAHCQSSVVTPWPTRCAPGQEQMRAIETYGRNSRVHALRALYAVKKMRLARTGQTERAGRRRPQLHPARGAHEAGRRHEGGRLSNSRHGHHRGKERSREHDRLGQFRPEYDRNRRASARRCS